MKPTNSPTQGQAYRRKIRLQAAFGPLFPTAITFRWLGLIVYRKQTTRNPPQPNSPQTPSYNVRATGWPKPSRQKCAARGQARHIPRVPPPGSACSVNLVALQRPAGGMGRVENVSRCAFRMLVVYRYSTNRQEILLLPVRKNVPN